MGSWSVYCQISNIAITQGTECMIIPLSPNTHNSSYAKYLTKLLPIEGIYNDRGGLESIVNNKNTKLIESITGVPIDDFVKYLVDGKFTFDREEVRYIKLKLPHLFDNMRFCWVRKDVYEFVASQNFDSNFDMGADYLLKYIGYEKQKEVKDGRYKYIWKKDNLTLFSDTNWLEGNIQNPIELSKIDPDNELLTGLINKDKFVLYNEMSQYEFLKNIYILDYNIVIDFIFANEYENDYSYNIKKYFKTIQLFDYLYISYIDSFRKDFVDLHKVLKNILVMSKFLEPYTLYSTPQCGDFKNHQILLNGFSEINKNEIF